MDKTTKKLRQATLLTLLTLILLITATISIPNTVKVENTIYNKNNIKITYNTIEQSKIDSSIKVNYTIHNNTENSITVNNFAIANGEYKAIGRTESTTINPNEESNITSELDRHLMISGDRYIRGINSIQLNLEIVNDKNNKTIDKIKHTTPCEF